MEIEQVESRIWEIESRIPDPVRRRLLPVHRDLTEKLEMLEAQRFSLEEQFRRLSFAWQ